MLNPAFIFDPLSIMTVIPPNRQDTVTLSFTNNTNSPVNYNFSYPAPLNWMSLAGPISGTLGGYATETIDVLFNSDSYPADTLFTYLTLYWGIDGISTIPVHLYVDPNVGVEEQGSREAWGRGGMELWPNPAREMLNVECWMLNAGENCTLSIYNSSGILIEKIEFKEEKKLVNLNLESYSPGMYVAILSVGANVIETDKFIINH
jgi:hypothetical protein